MTAHHPTLVSPRVAGALYLAIIALGLFGEAVVRGTLVVSGDAANTASQILGSQTLWRVGISTDLLMHVLDVPLIVFFYLLLRPVSQPIALLATVFNIVQTCVLAGNKLTLLAALAILGSAGSAKAESHALASLAIELHGYGFGIGLVFFGLACVARGYLLFQSGFVPRAIGVLLGLAGISYLVNSFALLLSPSFAAVLFPAVLLPAFLGELFLSVWLLFTSDRDLQQRMAPAALRRGQAR